MKKKFAFLLLSILMAFSFIGYTPISVKAANEAVAHQLNFQRHKLQLLLLYHGKKSVVQQATEFINIILKPKVLKK